MTEPTPPLFTLKEAAEQESRKSLLIEALCSGEVIGFLGAGGSIDAGYPDWNTLVNTLAAFAREETPTFLLPEAPAAVQVEAVKAELGQKYSAKRRAALTHVVDPFRDGAVGDVQEFHRRVVRLPWRGLVTTNYDLLQTKAYEEANSRSGQGGSPYSAVCCYRGDAGIFGEALRRISLGKKSRTILHLHGVIDYAPTMVCASSEYVEAYGFDLFGGEKFGTATDSVSPSLLAASVFALLLTQRVLFLGFSLNDDYIEYILRANTEAAWAWGAKSHFAVMPLDPQRVAEDKARAKELLEACGVAVIFYVSPNYTHVGRDVLLAEIVEEVERRLLAVSNTATAAPLVKPAQVQVDTPGWIDDVNARFLGEEFLDDN